MKEKTKTLTQKPKLAVLLIGDNPASQVYVRNKQKNITNDLEVINQIEEVFGPEYILNGMLDRKKMGDLVFNDKEANKKLTDIIHPIVKKRVINEIKLCKEQIVFVDVPLLYEAGFDDLCHYVICVYTDYENNLNRLMQRDNITKDQAVIKMKSQMDIELKKQMAHFIIDNSKDLCYTYKQVDEVIHELQEMRK